jgi:hypothetical protein
MSKSCEEYEIDLSSFLDGELPPAVAAAAFDHALSCDACASFYRAAHRLNAAAGDTDVETALDAHRAAEIWRRVRTAAAPRRWQRALRIAALLAVGVGAGYLLAARSGPEGSLAERLTSGTFATVASTSTDMDEHRFVALAGELLRSDPRYQRAMLEVLRLVPALETGEGLRTEDGPRLTVRARLDEARPGAGAI